MRILFIGGTGNISLACTREALRQGHEVTLLNRGTGEGPVPEGAKTIRADARDRDQVAAALGGLSFDCVTNWVAFAPGHVRQDVGLLASLTGQYLFISSAAVYMKPPPHWIITEETPVGNPYWSYAREKIACEELLRKAWEQDGFPVTVVRPSHTYADGWIPSPLGSRDYTVAARIREGRPVLSPGDGQSLWTVTHSDDFAAAFVGLLGNPGAIGETFHITSDEARTWDAFYRILGEALGTEPDIVHVPSEVVYRVSPLLGQGLMGDKGYSMVFDNSKIRNLVPDFRAKISFAEGIRRSLRWFEADPARRIVDPVRDAEIEKVLGFWKERLGGVPVV